MVKMVSRGEMSPVFSHIYYLGQFYSANIEHAAEFDVTTSLSGSSKGVQSSKSTITIFTDA